MAPNKRADNKKQIGLFVDIDLLNRFRQAADAFGLTMTSLIVDYMEDTVEKYEREYLQSHPESSSRTVEKVPRNS